MAVDEYEQFMSDLLSGNMYTRREARDRISEMGSSAIPVLLALLRSHIDIRRAEGAMLIAPGFVHPSCIKDKADRIVRALIINIADEDRGVRAEAARALGRLGEGACVAADAISDQIEIEEDSYVRRDLKEALQIIAPDRKPAEWNPSPDESGALERIRRTEARAIVRILIALARADGTVDQSEKHALRKLIRELGITNKQFEKISTQESVVKIAELPADIASRLELLTTLCALALADGSASASEQKIINTLARALNVDNEQLEFCYEMARKGAQGDGADAANARTDMCPTEYVPTLDELTPLIPQTRRYLLNQIVDEDVNGVLVQSHYHDYRTVIRVLSQLPRRIAIKLHTVHEGLSEKTGLLRYHVEHQGTLSGRELKTYLFAVCQPDGGELFDLVVSRQAV